MNELLSELSNYQQILCVTLIAAVAVQLFYLLFFYIHASSHQLDFWQVLSQHSDLC